MILSYKNSDTKFLRGGVTQVCGGSDTGHNVFVGHLPTSAVFQIFDFCFHRPTDGTNPQQRADN